MKDVPGWEVRLFSIMVAVGIYSTGMVDRRVRVYTMDNDCRTKGQGQECLIGRTGLSRFDWF